MIQHNQDTCRACGLCADICPRRIFEHREEAGQERTTLCAERVDLCIECGHCMALCATGSIRVGDLDPAGFERLPPLDLAPDALLALMRRRRTTRRYRDQPVPREVLDRIAEAARTAPTPTSRGVHILVVDRPDRMAELSRHTAALYEKLARMMGSPVMRFFVRRRVSPRTYHTLTDFLMPGLRWYLRWYREGSGDELTRGCPAAMLFHVPRLEVDGDRCCVIAATHAVLMAECLGVGSIYNGLIQEAAERGPELRALLGIPDDHEVCAALSLGYPRIKFKRTIPRSGGAVRYLE
jgi:nitroreductase/NAD-dependent dihydropyrimidine dehydrogenase PreA subunit